MTNLSEDIQCAGSDTRPLMLDRTDFASWQQRIRLYCWEKDMYNIDIRATNILLQRLPKDIYSLINHYTDAKDIWVNVKMFLEGSELSKEDRDTQMYDDFKHSRQQKGETIHDYYVQFTKLINDMRNIKMAMSRMQLNSKFITVVKLNKGLRDSNYDQLYAYLKQHEAHANKNKMILDRFTQHTVDHLTLMSNVSNQQHYPQSSITPPSMNQATIQDDKVVIQNVQGRQNRGQGNNARGAGAAGYGEAQNKVGYANPGQARQIKCYNCNGGQDNVVDDDVDEQPIQDLALNVDNVFQADDCDAFDSDVDEAPTAQTMFMSNLSSTYPVYDEVGPSYDSDVLSEVHDHDHYEDAVCEHHEVHEMHDDLQPNYVVDSHTGYTSDSNMIPYDQYVQDNAVQVVQSDVSVIPNDVYMIILNDMHEPPAHHVYVTTQTKVVDKSLTAELATYKEQVELYERRAKFKLTKKEQKIDEQLRIVITNRNIKEENLNKDLHYVKMQLASTINHNKLMVEKVTSLKKDFKQKENQYLEEFLDMKALKEKVEDKLFKQDQSLQTVHMLCKPKPYYDEQRKAAISYKSPLCLARVKQVQPAVYNGHEIIKTDHVPAIVHNSEDTLEIAKITRKKINEKMKAPLFEIKKLKASIQGKDNAIRKLRTQISQLQETRSEADRTLDFRALDFQITQLTEKVSVLQEQNELFRVENANVKQHYKKLYDSIKITCAKHIDQTRGDRSRLRNFVKKFTGTVRFGNDHFGAIMGYEDYVIGDSVISRVYYVEGLRHNLFSVAQFYDSNLEVAFRKHSWDRSRLRNFVKKFTGTVRFGNDHFGAIMGYEDYVIGDSVISRVYYVEGLRHNLFSVAQFYDSNLEVAFRKHSC
nr:integrase, catalytic region, zinc finger, CCHC-type, peptidase aspartic, catalytic [Tanacetum cinerariifolium]